MLANSRIVKCDPESSWKTASTFNSSFSTNLNFTGLTFDVQFMGYVPILAQLKSLDDARKKLIVTSCMKTVVLYSPMDQYQMMLKEEKVGPFIRLQPLDSSMLISKYTVTIFNIDGPYTKLIGRYPVSSIYSKFETIGEHTYFGFLATIDDLNECIVVRLPSERSKEHIELLLKAIEVEPTMKIKIDARMRSAQKFKLTKEMCPFYHGRIENFAGLLTRYGDFLFRESRNSSGIVLTYKNPKNPNVTECFVPPMGEEKMFKILQNYQFQNLEQFRFPVIKKE